jgi:hypothetical protein
MKPAAEKTAVELLFETLWDLPKDKFTWNSALKIAMEAEKEQMWKYIKAGYVNGPSSLAYHEGEFEQWYNETYGGKE